MVGESLIVEDQVLQGALLDGLHDEAVSAVHRGDHGNGAMLQVDGLGGTISCADAAAETNGLIHRNLPAFFVDGQDRADLCAFTAADTGLLRDLRNIIGGGDGMHGAEFSGGTQCLAAAAAAVAQEGGMFSHVLTDLHQIVVVGHSENVLRLRFVDEAGVASVVCQRTCHVVETEASLPGGMDLALLP